MATSEGNLPGELLGRTSIEITLSEAVNILTDIKNDESFWYELINSNNFDEIPEQLISDIYSFSEDLNRKKQYTSSLLQLIQAENQILTDDVQYLKNECISILNTALEIIDQIRARIYKLLLKHSDMLLNKINKHRLERVAEEDNKRNEYQKHSMAYNKELIEEIKDLNNFLVGINQEGMNYISQLKTCKNNHFYPDHFAAELILVLKQIERYQTHFISKFLYIQQEIFPRFYELTEKQNVLRRERIFVMHKILEILDYIFNEIKYLLRENLDAIKIKVDRGEIKINR